MKEIVMTAKIPHISTTVSKLGAAIPCINLPAIVTCRPDAPCKKLCYATHGRFNFANVKTSIMRNLGAYMQDPAFYFQYISAFMRNSTYRYFRWHSSGDIPEPQYLIGIVKVASENPDVRFLVLTKRYEWVNAYLDEAGNFPQNLNVVFSVWGSFPVPNPHNLPCAYVDLKNEECNIPETAHECTGSCASCAKTRNSCWNLKRGESTFFHQH